MSTSAALQATDDGDLERILQLADAERRAHVAVMKGGVGGNLEDRFEAHGEAVENLHNELYRQLDARTKIGDPVPKLRMPPDPRKELKKQIVARLKEELPSMVASIIDEF